MTLLFARISVLVLIVAVSSGCSNNSRRKKADPLKADVSTKADRDQRGSETNNSGNSSTEPDTAANSTDPSAPGKDPVPPTGQEEKKKPEAPTELRESTVRGATGGSVPNLSDFPPVAPAPSANREGADLPDPGTRAENRNSNAGSAPASSSASSNNSSSAPAPAVPVDAPALPKASPIQPEEAKKYALTQFNYEEVTSDGKGKGDIYHLDQFLNLEAHYGANIKGQISYDGKPFNGEVAVEVMIFDSGSNAANTYRQYLGGNRIVPYSVKGGVLNLSQILVKYGYRSLNSKTAQKRVDIVLKSKDLKEELAYFVAKSFPLNGTAEVMTASSKHGYDNLQTYRHTKDAFQTYAQERGLLPLEGDQSCALNLDVAAAEKLIAASAESSDVDAATAERICDWLHTGGLVTGTCDEVQNTLITWVEPKRSDAWDRAITRNSACKNDFKGYFATQAVELAYGLPNKISVSDAKESAGFDIRIATGLDIKKANEGELGSPVGVFLGNKFHLGYLGADRGQSTVRTLVQEEIDFNYEIAVRKCVELKILKGGNQRNHGVLYCSSPEQKAVPRSDTWFLLKAPVQPAERQPSLLIPVRGNAERNALARQLDATTGKVLYVAPSNGSEGVYNVAPYMNGLSTGMVSQKERLGDFKLILKPSVAPKAPAPKTAAPKTKTPAPRSPAQGAL